MIILMVFRLFSEICCFATDISIVDYLSSCDCAGRHMLVAVVVSILCLPAAPLSSPLESSGRVVAYDASQKKVDLTSFYYVNALLMHQNRRPFSRRRATVLRASTCSYGQPHSQSML
jgi:hypothetical protein